MPGVQSGSASVRRPVTRNGDRLFKHVLACVDRSPEAAHVLEQAVSLANLSGADLTAMRVMPGSASSVPHADPVDWELTRREEVADLVRMASAAGAATDMHAMVVCGSAMQCVHDEALRRGADLLVMGAGAFGPPHHWGLGGTARHLAETFRGSVLLVPEEAIGEPARRNRIVVPMDGSSSSEAALRYAGAIAQVRAADLVILHAVPEIGALHAGAEEGALWRELREEAAHAAEERLRRLRRLLPAGRSGDRVRQLAGEDPRRALMKAICEERAELVVLAARGLGQDPDLPIGSTAEYLLSRAVSPVLLIRSAEADTHRSADAAPRRPAAAREDR